MKSSESLDLRAFAKRKYGSLAGLAHALGVKPQSMNPYFIGTKSVGEDLAERLNQLGFTAKAYRGLSVSVDVAGIESVLGRPIEQAAPAIGLSPAMVDELRSGGVLTSERLAALLNLVVSVSLARLGSPVQSHSQSNPATEDQQQLTGT